jgi:CelD/BcsL family acetyltransferase involved in cellulose biosynthesis
MNGIENKIETRIIASEEELNSLKTVWDVLHQTVRGTIFQTLAWNEKWWEVYRQLNFSLRICTVWNGGILVGIFPFFKENYKIGMIRLSRFRFLGTNETYGEYAPIVHPDYTAEVVSEVVAYCKNELHSKNCDYFLLFRFPPTSIVMKKFLAAMEVDNFKVQYVPDCVPRIEMELPESWESYLKTISSNEKHMLHRRHQSLLKHGVEIEVVKDSAVCEKHYDDFIRLHNISWNVRKAQGYFFSKKFETFQKSIVQYFQKDGCARLYFLKKNGLRFAAVQAFFIHDVCCFYLSGLDRQHYLVHQSPGKVLLSLVIRDAIEEKYKIFDFQQGVDAYKYRLGGKRTSFAKAYIWKSGVSSSRDAIIWILCFLKKMFHKRKGQN